MRNAIVMVILLAALGLLTVARASIAQTTSQFSGDAEIGEKLFKKCKACHQIGAEAKNSTGPVLNNIIGRTAGSYEGYGYGKAMKAAGAKGLVWDEEQLYNYIANPKKFLRAYLGKKKAKAKMKFKLKKKDDRKNVVAYLSSISVPANKSLNMEKGEADNKEANALLAFHQADADQICVQNNYAMELLLVAEANGGERQSKTVGQSGFLCIPAEENSKGTVGIFENGDALEGCSRLAIAGKTEVLIAYASFDNCAWKN